MIREKRFPVQFAVSVPEKTAEIIRDLASAEAVSKAHILRDCIRRGLPKVRASIRDHNRRAQQKALREGERGDA